MAAPDPAHVRTSLLVSIAVTGVLGMIGIVLGIVGGSQMILLDGVYAIIGIVVSFLLLGASALAQVYSAQGGPPADGTWLCVTERLRRSADESGCHGRQFVAGRDGCVHGERIAGDPALVYPRR